MSNDLDREPRAVAAAAALFAIIGVLIGLDLVLDYGEGAGASHLLAEASILLASVAGVFALMRRVRRVSSDLQAARGQAERWRAEHREIVQGLGAAITSQFAQWSLTPSETEIGLFLLKGLSLKEIAELRRTSERTIREQARSIYRKAGLSGRHTLAAFFLEDLLPPKG